MFLFILFNNNINKYLQIKQNNRKFIKIYIIKNHINQLVIF